MVSKHAKAFEKARLVLSLPSCNSLSIHYSYNSASFNVTLATKSFANSIEAINNFHPKHDCFRDVKRVVIAREQSEGVGARVRKSIGSTELPNLDPFLLLDEFNVTKPAGFPDHRHGGMKTVTYMLEGAFHHEDNKGHAGTIGVGDLQWMTAGRGIVHSEMPATDGKG